MFSKKDINKAIDAVKEELDYLTICEPRATNEIEMLEFTVVSLEGYRDRERAWAMIREQEKLASQQ
jgi:hypothetical protein